MSVMTNGTATKRPRVETASIPNLMTVAPVPCRMIAVEVWKADEGGYGVNWSDVVGLLCVSQTEYLKRADIDGSTPRFGANHGEMTDLGWTSNPPYNWFPEVWPVLAGSNAFDEYPMRVLKDSSARHWTVAACHWPPSQDRENAERIARGLIAQGDGTPNWFTLSDPNPKEAAS